MKRYFLFFLIISAGCKQITIDDEYFIDGSGDYIYLSTSDLINPKSNFITYYDDNQNGWLFYGNSNRRELIIYKLPSGRIEKRIQFDSQGPDGIGGYRGVLVHNFDSIFLISSTHYNSFFLTDTTGKVKRKYTPKLKDKEIQPFVKALYSRISQQNVFQKNRINLSTRLPYFVNNENYYKEVISIDYDLVEGRIVGSSNYPKFQEKYRAPLGEGYSRAYNGEQFIYSFRRLDDIYVQNQDGSYSTYYCRSKFRTKSLDWVNNPTDPIIQQQKEIVNNPSYLSILYDKYRKYTYRFFLPGYDFDGSEHVQKHFEYTNLFSIMVLDENFKVIWETLLPEKTYDPRMKFVSKEGLYLALHIDHPLYNPDSLTFERMEIVKN